ncbi:MAG: leucine-rich repeat domain-containing protein [Clostridia bacterium]|nr:leucine-rich repeat domain-containing protein [Clostridia bacterium]
MKRVSVLLTLCLLLSVFLMTSCADENNPSVIEHPLYSGTCGDHLTWTLQGGVLTVSGTGDIYSYIVTVDDVHHGSPPWEDHTDLIQSIVIEDGVSCIGAYAFSNCTNVTDVSIPGSVKTIGFSAFIANMSLKEVRIPSGVEVIEDYAFGGCISLEKITLSDTVSRIAGDSILSPFAKTSVKITIDRKNPHFTTSNGILYSKDMTTLIACPTGKSKHIRIPDTVMTIGETAFCGNKMTDITLPDSVTVIENAAFSFCENLKEITLPDSVTTLRHLAFSQCTGLTSVTLSENLSFLGTAPFLGCTALTSVCFRGDVPEISDQDTNLLALFEDVSDDFVIQYIEGAEGWTSPLWTAPDGNAYNTVMIPRADASEK